MISSHCKQKVQKRRKSMRKTFYVRFIYPHRWLDVALSFVLMSITMPLVCFSLFVEKFNDPNNETIALQYLFFICVIIMVYYLIFRLKRQKRDHFLQRSDWQE
ncbi:MAG: hypothetical protein AUJ28_02610 [Parcubacteria group bacterium CG1_02_37_51]|uniref:Uncharacterized protein n=1 Tax=Candidatus Komeilibacteria bacterium CG_4_10_14_0_8_um_filter_37_78 TaxID=1974471 RepID=A0A2M7REJ7_9BACT|nr:MAG: hypothetical protein AUJ28_02610 [Parcubacteria group bacterium CG1_02_37_51]PIY95185.1 MAG: hypothetical protein COY67_01275 [Candidatus Komeilibacteria bacterium CG_4_10_14_0_8_um_filter_37_78]